MCRALGQSVRAGPPRGPVPLSSLRGVWEAQRAHFPPWGKRGKRRGSVGRAVLCARLPWRLPVGRHRIFAALQGGSHYPHFTDMQTEARRGQPAALLYGSEAVFTLGVLTKEGAREIRTRVLDRIYTTRTKYEQKTPQSLALKGW